MAKESTAWPIVTLVAVLLLGTIAILSIFHGSTTVMQQRNSTSTNHTITVTAEGYANGQPAQAQMYLTVNGTGASTQNAVANLSATVSILNRTLYAYVDRNLSNIGTSSYNVEEICNGTYYSVQPAIYPAYKCSSPAVYRAQESLTVLIPNQTNAGAAVNALSSIPDVYVDSVYSQFSNAQIAELRPIAISAAMSNATSQATAALGSGYNLSIVNVSVNNYNYIRPIPIFATGSGGLSSTSSPIIYSGTSSISESVTVTFAYAKKS